MRSLKKMLNIRTAREDKRDAICLAIKELRVIEFYYHGGYRTVEPFALGITLKSPADNESLICYQTDGFTDLREVVGWKLYRESEMEDIEVLNDTFTGDRPGYDPDHLDLDKIICYVRLMVKMELVDTAPPPKKLTIESSPIYIPPKPVMPPVVRYLTHNELMERFRYAHPESIPALDTALWPKPLVLPYPEPVKSRIWPPNPVLDINTYLVGQSA
jgi:hypothetical protein